MTLTTGSTLPTVPPFARLHLVQREKYVLENHVGPLSRSVAVGILASTCCSKEGNWCGYITVFQYNTVHARIMSVLYKTWVDFVSIEAGTGDVDIIRAVAVLRPKEPKLNRQCQTPCPVSWSRHFRKCLRVFEYGHHMVEACRFLTSFSVASCPSLNFVVLLPPSTRAIFSNS